MPKTQLDWLQEHEQEVKDLFGELNSYTKVARELNKRHGLNYPIDWFRKSVRNLLTSNSDNNSSASTIPKDTKDNSTTLTEGDNSLNAVYSGTQRIDSLEALIDYFDIDTKIWQADKFTANSWEVTSWKNGFAETVTNYQMKASFVRSQDHFDTKEFIQDLKVKIKAVKKKQKPGTNIGVLAVTDIHIGANSHKEKGLIRTKEFNMQILLDYLEQIKQKINAQKYKKVHVAILGDLIESVTGLNHINMWQSQDKFLGDVLLIGYEIIRDFIKGINNVEKIYIVSGNHDRMTSNKSEDIYGSAAQVISYILGMYFGNKKVEWHPYLISQEIDGINYIFEHGDKKFSKEGLHSMFYKYGKQGLYNVLLRGHLHTRKKSQPVILQELVEHDEKGGRSIHVAPLFTGNSYSETNGWTSTAGCSIIQANRDRTNIDHFDIGL